MLPPLFPILPMRIAHVPPTMKFYTKKILITCFGLLLRHRETKDRKTFICSPISEPGGKGEHEDKGNYMTVVN